MCIRDRVNRYLNKVSGPLLDRIDLHITVRAMEFNDMTSDTLEEDSFIIRERVIKADVYKRQEYIFFI